MVFSESPDERIGKTMDSLQSLLVGGKYGWIGEMQTSNGSKYYFYFIFKEKNRVDMMSDFDINTATVVKESSYRLKALQQPSLIFDTYSYIHLLSDPDPSVANGVPGKGLSADFEFGYDPTLTQKDTLKFGGRFNGSKLNLVRATKEQGDAYLSGELAKAFSFHNLSALSTYSMDGSVNDIGIGGKLFTYWKRFSVEGKQYEIDEGSFDPFAKSIRFSSYSATGEKTSFTTTYSFGSGKVVLNTPFTAGSTVIKEFTNLEWDDAAKTLTANINSTNTKTTFAGASSPIYYDTTAFTAFRKRSIAEDSYWSSDYGFMSNGTFNSFGMDTLTFTNAVGKYTYYTLIYWANYGVTSGFNYDLVSPIFLNPAQTQLSLIYAFAAVNDSPNFPMTKNGIASFTFGGFLGAANMPATGAWPNTISLFRANTGYYFVKRADGNYDQVSVSDAKSWITWVW